MDILKRKEMGHEVLDMGLLPAERIFSPVRQVSYRQISCLLPALFQHSIFSLRC